MWCGELIAHTCVPEITTGHGGGGGGGGSVWRDLIATGNRTARL